MSKDDNDKAGDYTASLQTPGPYIPEYRAETLKVKGVLDSPQTTSAAHRRSGARERSRYRPHLNGLCRLLWHGAWVQTAYDRTLCEGVSVKVSERTKSVASTIN